MLEKFATFGTYSHNYSHTSCAPVVDLTGMGAAFSWVEIMGSKIDLHIMTPHFLDQGSASALGARKPGLFALLFLTSFSKKQ